MPRGIPESGVNKGWIKKGKKLPREWVEKMKGNKNHLGRKHGQETREKMSKNNSRCWLGRKHSQETKDKLSGEKSVHWKGEDARYTSQHQWVSNHRGKPSKCEICGTIKNRRYHWANVDHKYRRVLSDYFRACVPCHKEYDKENN